MQLVVIRMEHDVAAEPERPALFFGHRVELQLVFFVDRLRRHARKIAAGHRDERRGRIGLNARLLDIEIRKLHGVGAARRERVDSRAVAQPVRAELADDRQIRGRPGRFADDVRRTRERPVEALRERLEIRHGDVVRELRFSESPSASVPATLAFRSGPVEDQLLDVRHVVAERSGRLARVDRHSGNRRFLQASAVPLTFNSSVGPTFGTVSATAMSADPFSVVPASSLRSREQRSRQLFERTAELRANLARGHLEVDRGGREPRARKRRVDERRVGVQHELVDRPAAAGERECARQRAVEPIVVEPLHLERRRETSRVQPRDVAARGVAELTIARLRCRAACPARSAHPRPSSRRAFRCRSSRAPAPRTYSCRRPAFRASASRADRAAAAYRDSGTCLRGDTTAAATASRNGTSRASSRRAVRGAAGIEAQHGLPGRASASRGTSYTPCARTFAA